MYVDRMSPLWVEGQVVEYKVRPGAKMHFLTLRDLQTDTSMTVTAWAGVMDSTPLTEGARVVTRVKPVFWERAGRPVGPDRGAACPPGRRRPVL